MNKDCFTSSVYICDYAHYSEEHTEYKTYGVVASETKDNNVLPFYLSNPKSIPFDFVSFDRNKALIKRPDGSFAKHCECFCEASCKGDEKRWMLLLELKYCAPKNIKANINEGIKQVFATYEMLKSEEKAVIKDRIHRTYFVISLPENSPSDSFSGFIALPDDLVEIKERHNITVFYTNSVEIVNSMHIRDII